ncbi:ubiquitin domain-containing protein DSK2b-like isoform X1 [Rhododendron vialii]|uniref:ubiquitin domain-containing protein DSK2b-like isoform X1 n=1 Tax=Rhododendron vialii TaxID=182163 RepID=UPI00266055B0|nr:ubiquitin domain-containing protein DSK2b-like isoform X1 [Rhododendron vialii]
MGSGAAEAAESHAVAGGGVTVHIRCFNGSKFSVQISLDSTVGSLKSVVAQNCDAAAERQRLIYKGRVLKDEHTLESYGLEADHTVHLVRGFAPATSAVSKVASDPGVPNSTPSGMTSVGSGECGMCGGYSLGASLSSGLGYGLSDNSELFGAGLPILQQVQQKLTQNPNLMREIIDMPSVHNVVDNQNIMQNVIMNDPQIDELIDRNPELAHILTDPSTIRRMLEAARNPALMHDRMRNTDRVMSNNESPPEGLNMLRRMYENAQEPFLNATTRGGDARNDLGSNPFSTDSQTTSNSAPNANPLPNPWASGGAGGAQTNSNPRLNPAGDVRLPALGGLGHLDYQPVFGSTEDTASLSQFMQNPAVSQMQSVLSNPQYMTQQLLTLRQALQSRLGHQPSTGEGSQTGGVTDNAGLETLMNMFGGLGTGNPSRALNMPREELYATQLLNLQEMGFMDPQENIQALIATTGNVHAAVERLLGNLGQ